VLTGAPLDIVAIDILSGFPPAADGSKYLLVLTDYYTKWSEAYALPDAEASTCMRAMYDNFFARFGLCRQLHSDLGRNFQSRLFAELCSLTGINKSRTTPFHPRSDGQTERMNRTILQMLRATIVDNPQDWPSKIPTIMAAYRMTRHSTTGLTPNYAMFAREVLLPAHLIARPPEEPVQVSVPYVVSFQQNMRQAHERVRQATHAAAKVQKTYFDRLVKGPVFAVGQLVWLFWPRPLLRMQYKKLQRHWTGPFRIIEFRTQVVVVLQHVQNHKKQTVHIDRLSPCLSTVYTPPAAAEDSSTVLDDSAHAENAETQADSENADIAGADDTPLQTCEQDSQALQDEPLQPSQARNNLTPHRTPIIQTPQPFSRPQRSRRRPKYLVDYF